MAKNRKDVYGKPDTAAKALAKWDAGNPVFTVEMGGLGPSYEQCIHIVAFEIIRELLTHQPIDWKKVDAVHAGDADAKLEWRAFTDNVEAVVLRKVSDLRLSGAQWAVAQSFAYIVVRKGWRAMLDELPSDRLIQVSKDWPRIASENGPPAACGASKG